MFNFKKYQNVTLHSAADVERANSAALALREEKEAAAKAAFSSSGRTESQRMCLFLIFKNRM